MTRPLEEVITDLNNVRRVTEDNFEAFETLVGEACEGHPSMAIGPLLGCLDDACELDEVMFGVIHALESFAWSDYFAVLAERLPQLLAKSPRWGSILVTRIMNSATAYPDFLAALSTASDASKQAAVELMQRLAAKERFQKQCEAGIRRLASER